MKYIHAYERHGGEFAAERILEFAVRLKQDSCSKCNQLSFCIVLNAEIIFMETNNVWSMCNCTYRSVYVKIWVTDSHITQH
jgi:hypothetical protein